MALVARAMTRMMAFNLAIVTTDHYYSAYYGTADKNKGHMLLTAACAEAGPHLYKLKGAPQNDMLGQHTRKNSY